jgi:uncharacterized GH25 family protein
MGILILVLSIASAASAQQTTVTIRGRVVAGENSQPMRRALITPVPRGAAPVMTDDEGRFEYESVSSQGITSFIVTKGGYAPATVEIKREAVKSREEIEVRLSRGAAISGRVMRSSGTPVAGAVVRAIRIDTPDSKEASKQEASKPGVAVETTTDDLGEFRISGLVAGRYDVSPLQQLTPQELGAMMAQRMRIVERGQVITLPPVSGRAPTVGLTPDDVKKPLVSDRAIDIRAGDDAGPVDFQVDSPQLQIVHMPLPIDEPDRMVPGMPLSREGIERARGRAAERERTGGVISGAIVDQAGEPLEGVHVRALRVRRDGGSAVAGDIGLDRVTDDRGRYRLFGLPPGKYYVMASTDAEASGLDRAQGNAFTKVYFPGTPSFESAQALQVDESLDTSGINLTFGPSRSVRVTGVALDASGQPLVGQVRLVMAQNAALVTPEPLVERVDWDGKFEIGRVPPGSFVVQAVGTNPGHRDEFGAVHLTVEDRDPAPLVITTSVGATLEGRFIVEGVRRPALRTLSIHASPNDLDRAPAEGRGPDGLAVFDEGRFTLSGLRGSMRLVPGDLPSGWYLKSLTIGGIDATETPFDFGFSEHAFTDAEILLSPLGGTISGAVTQTARTRASSFVALAFSTTRDRWFTGSQYVRQGSGGANGSFDLVGLPPGDYFVIALERLDATDWQTADVLESLAQSATRVTVAEGQLVSTELRLVPGR